MLEEAEKRLKKIKEEAEDSDKRFNEDIQKWQDKRVELNKTLDQIAKPTTPENNIHVLALLRDKCLGMNRYFNQIRNYTTDVTFPNYTTSPISSRELHLDISQHSIKIEVSNLKL